MYMMLLYSMNFLLAPGVKCQQQISGFNREATRGVGDCFADFITTWSATEPKDTCFVDWLSRGWYIYIYTAENLRRVGLPQKKSIEKENHLNRSSMFGVQDVGFPGWHVKVLRPCFYMRSMTESSYERFDSIIKLRLLAMFNPRNLARNGMIDLYDLIFEISCGYVLMLYIYMSCVCKKYAVLGMVIAHKTIQTL